jgi:hypothetical protein
MPTMTRTPRSSGARTANEDEHVIDEHRDDEDVENVVPATALAGEDLLEHLVDGVHLIRQRQLLDLGGKVVPTVEPKRLHE